MQMSCIISEEDMKLTVRLSIVSHFFMEAVCAFEGGYDHLAENRFLFLEFCQLLLEVIIFLFLVYHSQLQRTVQRLNQRVSSLQDLLVYVLYFSSHGVQLLPKQFDQFMVFLEIFVGFSGQVLIEKKFTSTMPRWPMAWVEFCPYLYGESERWLMGATQQNKYNFKDSQLDIFGNIYFQHFLIYLLDFQTSIQNKGVPLQKVSFLFDCNLLQMQQKSQKQQQISLSLLERYHAQLNELYENNINLRMKYPTEPLRFYQTQQQIDNILQSLQEITQENIPILIQSKLLVSILKILNHPNSDINMSCIEFLHEIISEQPQNDEVFQIYYRMCVWLTENGLFQSLVETILKMKEEESVEQYQIALKILKIIQTLTEQVQQSILPLVSQTKILEYLSNRIMPNYVVKHKVIDDNKYVGSDLLAFLLSNSQKAQITFHILCGVEIIIQSIRPYLSKTPESSDEQQYLGNLFDCLNILLINPAEELAKSRHVYHEMQGNSIMLQFLKQKNESSVAALKAIANSFTKAEPKSEQIIVQNLIEYGGLKYIFPIVMKQGVKGKDIDQQMMIDQNCLNLVSIMIRSASEIYKIRVQAKLSQKRFEKLEKMFEIRTEYMQNMGKQALKEVEAEDYIAKLKEGLGVVEVVDKIICLLIFSSSTIKQKLIVLMKLYGVSAQDIQFILKTKYTFIKEGFEKTQLQKIISESLPAIKTLSAKKQQKIQ